MKIVVADKRGISDGAMHNLAREVNSDLPILIITRPDGYQFNEEILMLRGRKYLIWDAVEMGWDAKMYNTHVFGRNHYEKEFDGKFVGGEWDKLEDFITGNEPAIYFSRELKQKDQSDYLVPLNYPAQHPIPEPETKEQFYNRPLDVFYSWGFSHPERRRLHGQIWMESNNENYMVGDNIYFLKQFLQNESNPHRWLTLNLPHYCRFPSEEVIAWNALAKISISMPGAGTCCFRHTEASSNSVMLMKSDGMAWSFPWIKDVNCLKFHHFGEEISSISTAWRVVDIFWS